MFTVHMLDAGYLIWHVWICVQLNQQDCMTTLQGNFTLIHTWKYPTRTLSLTTLLKLHFPTPGIFQNGEYLSGEALSDNTSVVGNDSRNPQRQTRGIYSTIGTTPYPELKQQPESHWQILSCLNLRTRQWTQLPSLATFQEGHH